MTMPTPEDFENGKQDLDDISLVLESEYENVHTRGGKTRKTLKGLQNAFVAGATTNGIFEDVATGIATTNPGEFFSVPDADDELYLGLYRHNGDGTATLRKRYPSAEAVSNVKNLNFEALNITQFALAKGKDASRLLTPYDASGVLRGEIYRAVKSLKIYLNGVQKKDMYYIRALWNDVNGNFRLVIEAYSNGAWAYAFDSGNVSLSSLNVTNSEVLQHTFVSGTADVNTTVNVEIDLSLLPVGSNAILNNESNYDLLIAEKCFYNNTFENEKPLIQSLVASENQQFKDKLQSKTVALYNDYFTPVWSRYKSNIDSLDNEFYAGISRKQIYQCFKNVELLGFNSSQPIKLEHFWVDAYQPAQALYRIILSQFNGTDWTRVYDVSKQKSELDGYVEGRVYRWNYAYQGRTLIADIDFSNAVANYSGNLNNGEPEFVFSQSCFKEVPQTEDELIAQRLEDANVGKRRFTSRRKAVFSFIWDDLNDSDDLVFNLFKEFGFPCDFALKGNVVTDSSIKPYLKYYLQGSALLAHSMTHPLMGSTSTLTDEQAFAQMMDSKKVLEKYNVKVSGWVTPSSVLKNEWTDMLGKVFGYGYTTQNSAKFDTTVDPLKMGRFGLEGNSKDNNIQPVKDKIDQAIANKEYVAMYGHKLPSTYTNADGTSYLSVEQMREILTYLKEKVDAGDCDVLNSDDAVTQYYGWTFA